MQKNIFEKLWPLIKKYKILRTLSLLCSIFIIFIIIFLITGFSYNSKISANETEIAKNEQALLDLQKLILTTENKDNVDISLFQNKSFADFDEVIPFIALLENMFSKPGLQAEIAIKSQEDQIFIDHFADYSVSVKVSDPQVLFGILKDLYDSRFITKVMSFTMQYDLSDDGETNVLKETDFTIRLYLK
jgi:hypothetical protein